jgi:hypothetical protein
VHFVIYNGGHSSANRGRLNSAIDKEPEHDARYACSSPSVVSDYATLEDESDMLLSDIRDH